MSAFMPKFEQLPLSLAIFPLDGILLLPGYELPLRIFEPRYLQMIDDAIKGSRLIGMVQPIPDQPSEPDQVPEVFALGTVGRITSFTETDEGTYNIVLTGVIRFQIEKEHSTDAAYRTVAPNFAPFQQDMQPPVSPENFTEKTMSDQMLAIVERYFVKQKIDADMESVQQAPIGQLVSALAMSCPFSALEKQALLEATNDHELTQILLSLMEMAATESVEPSSLN